MSDNPTDLWSASLILNMTDINLTCRHHSPLIMGVRKNLIKRVEHTFFSMGVFAEHRPWTTVFLSIFLTFMIGMGAPNIFMETESYELWVPKSSVAYTNYKHVNSNFLSGTRGVVILYKKKDEGNILELEPLLELLEIHHNLTTAPVFQDACNKVDPSLPCQYNNIFSVFGYDESALRDAAASGQLLPAIQNLAEFVPLTTMLGGIEFEEDGKTLKTAKVIRNIYGMGAVNTTDPERPEILDTVLDFESEIQDHFFWDFNDEVQRVGETIMITQRSVDDEIGRLVQVDVMLFVIAINAIIFLLAVTWSVAPKKFCGSSRISIGFASSLVILLSILFSFGVMGFLSLTANMICVMIAFIVAGVGVDDCIVVENFYQKQIDMGKGVGERMGPALEHGGLAIFLTTSSSVLAFVSGIWNDMPGVSQFCRCGALSFTWILFLSCTLFPAMLVLDQRRIEAGKAECIGCCSPALCKSGEGEGEEGENGEKGGGELASTWLGETLTPILVSGAGKVLFPIFFASLAVLSVVLLSKNETGLGVGDVVPDDSYVVDLVETSDKYWGGDAFRVMSLVFVGNHYVDAGKVAKMEEYFEWIEGRSYVKGNVGMIDGHWYDAFVGYMEEIGVEDRYEGFNENLSGFLNDERYMQYRGDVTCVSGDYGDCGSGVKCAKFAVWQTSVINTMVLYEQEVEINDKIAALGFADSYNWLDEFGFAGELPASEASRAKRN